jgi:adenosylcobinamide-GDP ribazoletransferase
LTVPHPHVNGFADTPDDMTDTPPEQPRRGKMRPFAELLHSLRFLTRVPIPFANTVDPPPLSQSMRLFPLAGAMIGAAGGAALVALTSLGLPSLVAAALTMALGLLVTGALHEDGLADTADGFGGGKSRERRLEIMRDSHIGSYGTLALIASIFIRTACYEDLSGLDPWAVIAVLGACGAFSRALMVDLLWATRPARSDGLAVHAGTPGRNGAAFAIITAAALTLAAGLLVTPPSGLIALAAGLAVTAYMRRLTVKLIGGQTGDVCGAVQVLSELAMLIVFVATSG